MVADFFIARRTDGNVLLSSADCGFNLEVPSDQLSPLARELLNMSRQPVPVVGVWLAASGGDIGADALAVAMKWLAAGNKPTDADVAPDVGEREAGAA